MFVSGRVINTKFVHNSLHQYILDIDNFGKCYEKVIENASFGGSSVNGKLYCIPKGELKSINGCLIPQYFKDQTSACSVGSAALGEAWVENQRLARGRRSSGRLAAIRTNAQEIYEGGGKVRPPKPRYNCVWEPRQIFNYFETHPAESLKALSMKLITLLTLATGQRLQTLSLIKISNILTSENLIQIVVPDRIKTSRVSGRQPCLILPRFNDLPHLCVFSCLQRYLQETEKLREGQENLFLTYQRPYRTASKQTLSRWVKCKLQLEGVDTSIFKPHSSRHASTSAAKRAGVSIDVTKDSAGWSRSSQRFR
ncbi:hypothetical protein PPYR_06902 [Photinus pyralis]|uniref:Tyr recombinase domain-containing protein n=1 Tax=Photinus pyralis TaxID=7054 RepID=A0A5N4ANU6_PHOPY|nr:hypothetical protein PPYR_06902 [Photinus pyralis]